MYDLHPVVSDDPATLQNPTDRKKLERVTTVTLSSTTRFERDSTIRSSLEEQSTRLVYLSS
jgi:hypothetical protein